MFKKNLIALGLMCFLGVTVRADEFDHYLNPTLQKMIEGNGFVQERAQVHLRDIADLDFNIQGSQAGFIVVKTNGGRLSKVLVQFAKQKIDAEKSAPMAVLERFTTYREGTERTVLSSGQNVALFNTFHFSLDLGQIVPGELQADLEFGIDEKGPFIKSMGSSKLFQVRKKHPEARPEAKISSPVLGPMFEIKYFNGNYHLHDDGRRSGKLTIMVDGSGDVSGSFYSDKDGQKYDIRGKVGAPPHSIQFVIKFPRIEQVFQGFLFTGDAKAIAGSSRLVDRESAFYATRE